MSYDPMWDSAKRAVDEVLGKGEYAKLNANNLHVPKEFREKLKEELANEKKDRCKSRDRQ